MKHTNNNLAVLMGSYHQVPVEVKNTFKTRQVGDTLMVDRWNEVRGAWDTVKLTWDGEKYVTA